MPKKPLINYTNLDFASIKDDLIEHAKRYYPKRYNDFNESSFGAMMFDSVAYVGDMLSFYLDYQVNEGNMETALQYDNVRKKADQLGYNFFSKPSTFGFVDLYVVVPALPDSLGPNEALFPIIKAGTLFTSDSGTVFTLVDDVDFGNANVDSVAARYDSEGGRATQFALRYSGKVKSGASYYKEVDVGSYEKFRKVRVGGNAINEIISVFDSEGHEYYQVEHLSQEIIYKDTTNPNAAVDGVRAIMKPFSASRRFIVKQDSNGTYLQFGYGSENEFDSSGVIDPARVMLDMDGKNYIADKGFDPNKLISTDKFGIVPTDTTLQIVYGSNNSSDVNTAAGYLNTVESVEADFPYDTVGEYKNSHDSVKVSLEVSNPSPIIYNSSLPTVDEIKYRAYSIYSSQNRIVTKTDFEAYAYQMPPKFGIIKRACVYNDPSGTNKRLVLYTISENDDGYLTTTNTTTKANLKTWINKNKMINDLIDIKDAKIINIGFDYEFVVDSRSDRITVLQSVQVKLITMFLEKLYVGEPIYVTNVYNAVNKVKGVVDTIKVTPKVLNTAGYAETSVDIDDLLSGDGTYIKCPKNCILDIKYPEKDIKGITR